MSSGYENVSKVWKYIASTVLGTIFFHAVFVVVAVVVVVVVLNEG
tara:strand:+ start:431 stop:565 length:135 start_codon:yes stop_codon:yes gene_type:complete